MTKLTKSGQSRCIPHHYDRHQPQPDRPVQVAITFNLVELYNVDDLGGTVELKTKVRMSWHDSRINTEYHSGGKPFFEHLDLLWMPEVSIERLMSLSDSVLVAPGYRLWVTNPPHSRVVYEFDIHAKLSCLMDFGKFPFDTQECFFRMYSLQYEDERLCYH